MPTCPHDWLPMTAALEECSRCGARRTPPTLQADIAARWSALSVEHAAKQMADAEARFMASRARCVIPDTIPTTTIKGVPIEWPPIDETESHD